MTILYINHSRMPTEKAHGINIASMSGFFYKNNHDFRLIVPRLDNTIKDNIFDYYGLDTKFPIKYLPTFSAIKFEKIIGPLAFWLQLVSFYISVCFYLLFKKRAGVLIYTRDYLAAFLSFLGYRVVYECHSIPAKEKIFFKFCKLFKKIIVISRGLEKYFIKYGFDQTKIFIAPDAVNIEIFDIDISKQQARAKLHLPDSKKIVCYTGKFKTMGMDKGIADILSAIVSLDVLFVAIGGGPKDIEYYQNMADNLGIKSKVLFLGHVKQDVLAIYQKAADILLMPFPQNKHYADFMSPIKMFEYMAASRPIIASDLPTIREILHENNSVFCQPDNPGDLADKIKILLADEGLAKKISDAAYQDVQEYTWDKRAKKILEFIS